MDRSRLYNIIIAYGEHCYVTVLYCTNNHQTIILVVFLVIITMGVLLLIIVIVVLFLPTINIVLNNRSLSYQVNS